MFCLYVVVVLTGIFSYTEEFSSGLQVLVQRSAAFMNEETKYIQHCVI